MAAAPADHLPEHAPPAALEAYVSSVTGFREHLDPRAVHHGSPSVAATVIVSFDQPLDCGWLRPPAQRSEFWDLVSGLHDAPALIRTHGRQHGIQLGLTPLGVRALLGLPMGAIGRTLASWQEMPLALPDEVSDRLRATCSWSQRFRLLDDHLIRTLTRHRLEARHQIAPELRQSWRRLAGDQATSMSVSAVAAEIGWSRRHLSARFHGEFGLTPQTAIRVARFGRAQRLLRAGVALPEIAHRTGYADQSHLTREWQRLGGTTPSEGREVFPIVQDAGDRRGSSLSNDYSR